jgi:hypothetical protein
MATNHPEAKRTNRKGSANVIADKASRAAALNEDDPRIQTLAKKAPPAENDASLNAIQDRIDHPLKYLKDGDIRAVSKSLNEAAYGLLSIHWLSIDASDGDDDGFYRVAITHLSRSAFKILDACIKRLESTQCGIGNFATEFDFD